MKIAIRVTQIIVAVLFIISGLVKANDPLGLSYKMQEFFELWNSELAAGGFFLKNILISVFAFLHEYSLLLSVIMITLEIVAGVALLISWKKKFILYLLLLLIVFFTFLTGYAYLSGKFTNCGCFGDCLPITPFASFMKDLVLVVLILFLLMGQRYLMRMFSGRVRGFMLALSLVFSIVLQWYVLTYLPLVDCLPFKKGNSISEQMKPPPGSIPDSIAIRFIYEKDGKRYEFAPENLPADFTTYKYIDRIDKVVRKGNAEPKVKGFALTGLSGTDSTEVVLNDEEAYILFCNEVQTGGWLDDFKQVVQKARARNVPVYVSSASAQAWAPVFLKHGITDVQFFNLDFTVIRTVARTNPTLLHLKKGTIVEKFGKHEIGDAVKP